MALTLAALAAHVGGRVRGRGARRIEAVAPLASAGPSHLSFLAHPRYRPLLASSRAGAVLLSSEEDAGPERDLLVHPEPYRALARILSLLHPEERPAAGVHPTAWVAASARVHPRASVGPGAVVEEGAEVGEGTSIGANAVVGRGVRIGSGGTVGAGAVLVAASWLGDRVRIGEGAVVGSAGFGFVPGDTEPEPIPQVGRVVIEDGVEIGANATVDRATLGETRIGRGTKVDNLVQLGHNVAVGRGVLIAAQAGVAGSTRIGDGVMIGGQAGVVGHVEVGDLARIGAGAGVASSVPPGATVSGGPAFDHRAWRRAMLLLPRLPDLFSRLRRMESRLRALEGTAPGPALEEEDP